MAASDEFKAAAIQADRNLTATDEDQPAPAGLTGEAALAYAATVRPAARPAPTAAPTPEAPAAPELTQEQFRAAAQKAYENTRSPLEAITDFPMVQFPMTAAKRLASDIAGITAAPAQAGAVFIRTTTEAPSLQGLPVDQVRQVRSQMQQSLADAHDIQDGLMKTGDPDGTQIFVQAERINSLNQRIKEADDIIKSGRPSTAPSVFTEPLGNALAAYGRAAQPAVSAALDQALPTNQEFVNSLPGQIASYGADAISMLGAEAVLPGAGGALAGGGIFANQAYQEAKAAGASDQTAEIASGMTVLSAPLAFGTVGPASRFLGNTFAGLSAKEGVNAIVRAGANLTSRAIKLTAPGAEMAAFNLQNNAIARLSGYDPNRSLDQNFWQNFWLGEGFGLLHTAMQNSPRLSSLIRPDVKVREKEGAPPAAPAAPAAAPVTPAPAAAAPADIAAQAQAAAAATAAPPEEVIAKADPEAELNKFADTITAEPTEEKPSFVLGAGAEPVYTGPARPERAPAAVLSLGAPSTETLEKQGEQRAAPDLSKAQDDLQRVRQYIKTSKSEPERQKLQAIAEWLEQQIRDAGGTPTPTAAEVPRGTLPAEVQALDPAIQERYRQMEPDEQQRYLRHLQQVTGLPTEERAAFEERLRQEARERAAAPVPPPVDEEAIRKEYVDSLPEASRLMLERGNPAMVQAVDNEVQARLSQARKAAAPEAVPASELPPTAAPKKRTGYMVHWVDDSRPENDLSRYQQRSFRRSKDAQAFARSLKKGPNIQIRMEDLFHPPAWYEGEAPAARVPLPAELPADRPVGLADVKSEVNQAQEHMGMEDNLVYVAHAEDLPDHVKDGLSDSQLNSTAQIATDRKLGKVYIIGDRFDSLNDLRQKIIEETLPYRYRNVARLNTVHDPADNRLGFYDLIGDRPVLNTHAILRADNPYAEAMRTAMEEINVHQGISRLLGNREGARYIQAMNDVQAQFNRLGLNDILAQKKGYANADAMAAEYGVPDWKTDPKSAHKMTEELIGSYSRTFRTPEELTANAPGWYQRSLRNIADGIRNFLGLRVEPYDVQRLLNDSAAALRQPKLAEPSAYHVTGDQAKADMQAFQYANKPPGEEVAGPKERADIGTEMVRGRIAELEAALRPGQQLRTQPIRLAMQGKRTIQERLNFLRDWPSIIDHEGHQEIMQTVLDMFHQDFGNDPYRAMDFIMNSRVEGARNPALAEVTSRAATDEINALRSAGQDDQANLLAARLDRMNQIQAQDATEAARETAAQRLRHMDGTSQVARHKNKIQEAQDNVIHGETDANAKVNQGKKAVDAAASEAAGVLKQKADSAAKKIAKRWGTTMSLPQQYTQDLVDRIHDAMFKTNTAFSEQDKPALQGVFDTFRDQIQRIIKERAPAGVPTAQLEFKVPKPKATDTLRTILDNYPYYKEAWAQTMDMLYSHNPELAQRFARSIEEPIGETLANKLATEQGQNLSDLIFKHYSTTDRINTDLATKIMNETGIRGDIARTMAQHLQNMFADIVRTRQQDKLQSILDAVDGPKKAPRGQLDRLVDHIVIGGLDRGEWLNLVAPRFGIEHYTSDQIDTLRSAGDYMSYLRDNGLSNSAIAQEVRMQMGDIMKLSRGGLERSKQLDQLRYITDVYTASLLTGPLTHAPYWQQGILTQVLNDMSAAARAMTASKGEVNREILLGMGARMMNGLARGAYEFMPILRAGIKPAEEAMPQRGGQPLYRGALEKVQIEKGRPGTWFANYKYVRNFLDAISNLMVRGSQYATHHAMAMKLAWDDGFRGQDAWDAAEKTVLGSPEMQQKAIEHSHEIVDQLNREYPGRPVSEDYRKMLQGELLDEYKTTSQNPDSMLADAETQKLRDVQRRAFAPALRGALRGDVPGMWGKLSRGLLDFTSDYPGFKTVAPFLKVPFNLVNEQLSWSPIGMWRSAADLVPSTTPLGSLIRQVAGLREGIRGYLKDVPGAKAAIERGEISTEQIRDFAWEQMLKGIIGTSAGFGLWGLSRYMMSNPNAPIRFTNTGPSQFGQQQIERGKGWQPKSVYFGDAWHSYENTPWRALFAGIGAMEDYFRYEKQAPDVGMNEVVAAYRMLAGGLSSVFGSPLQGPETAMQLLTQMGGPGGVERAVSSFVNQTIAAGITVPFGGTGARQIARLFAPGIHGEEPATEYEATTPWGAALRYVPVLNSMFGEPKLNVFGEHMQSSPLHNIPEYSPSGGLLGLGIGRVVDPKDPVWNYLGEHPGLHLTMPGNSASVAGIKMTPDEIYQYHLARGPYLKQELTRAFADPHFAELPEPRQNEIIKRVYEHTANLVGRAAVMNYRKTHSVDPERIAQRYKAKGLPVPAVETVAAPAPAQTE